MLGWPSSTTRLLTHPPINPSDAPLKITLAYYDYPAAVATTSRALVNNLDVTASHAGQNYSSNGAASPAAVVNTRNTLEQITIAHPAVGQPVVVRVVGTSVARGPQPYALAITGQFRKDATLFPHAVPRVDALATDGEEVRSRVCMDYMRMWVYTCVGYPTVCRSIPSIHYSSTHRMHWNINTNNRTKQALLVGANLPRSAAVPQSLALTCLSDPALTPNMTAQVTAYSATAKFLALKFGGTTECTRFALQITSNDFVGEPVPCVFVVVCRREGGAKETEQTDDAMQECVCGTVSPHNPFLCPRTAWPMAT